MSNDDLSKLLNLQINPSTSNKHLQIVIKHTSDMTIFECCNVYIGLIFYQMNDATEIQYNDVLKLKVFQFCWEP